MENKIPHRDLKPENIMVDENKKVKIIDYGTCKNLEDQGGKTDTFWGTAYFLAPEIAKRNRYGIEWDIWSLGVILHYMLLKKYPVQGVK